MSRHNPPKLLKRVNHCQEAPEDAYLLYDLNGGIFWVSVKDYPNFTLKWIGISNPPALTMDLSSTGSHSLILDFDYYPQHPQIGSNIFQTIETVLKITFLPTLPHFTYILSLRPGHQGIHVHLPEFQIGHDDYILLLGMLQFQLKQALLRSDVYKLDILMNAMLPKASKPGKQPYVPFRLVYVDEKATFQLTLSKWNDEYPVVQRKFTKRKSNENSLFRKWLHLKHLKMLRMELLQIMMPVVCLRTGLSMHTLSYATSIGKEPNVSSDWQDVASFIDKKTKQPGYLSKCKTLLFDCPGSFKVFHHLKLNAWNMIEFVTTNHALKQWFERFCRPSSLDSSHIPEVFRDVHEMLQFEHTGLADNPNPMKTILQYNEGYYFLPVFYTLCQHYQKDSRWMAKQLYTLLDKDYHPLLDKLQAISPKTVQSAGANLSLNTLHFCANNLHPEPSKSHRDKLKSIVDNHRRALLSVTTDDQLVDLVRSMQERHLPIRVLKLRNALKKPSRYIWNALTESWMETNGNTEISDHLQNLWSYIKQFYVEYKKAGGIGGPEEDVVHRFSVSHMVSMLQSDSVMERKDIQMDRYKWFLRLQDGVLDLLTGHIGGVVPEFFLSDRRINLALSRKHMIQLCHFSPDLEALYETLTCKSFFLKYLQALCLDRTESLIQTLSELLPLKPLHETTNLPDKTTSLPDKTTNLPDKTTNLPDKTTNLPDKTTQPFHETTSLPDDTTQPFHDEMTQTMLHFYVNLCKFTSFDYELLLYMLDVLASVLVGTNYERKFFVCKGLTRNGKSKLFELMGRVLGGYYHSIQSENLSPGHSANNATPELASTLFSCRMVTTEELEKRLDENRIKQITGNSHVTFRNMYEQNAGGIPTAKLFASTNNYPECKASEAFKDRVVAIPFDAEFVSQASSKTSSQIETNTYSKETYVVEQSYMGCFFILYYHLKKHMNPEDGLLHYRKQPECVVEFTRDYLIHADIYVQFKLHMDVQRMTGSHTTLNDVKSAVRQFLKATKNTAFHEADLLISFEKEFGDLRQTELQMDGAIHSFSSFSYTSVADEPPRTRPLDPSPAKKMKWDSSLVFYDGVVIKNLRKQNGGD